MIIQVNNDYTLNGKYIVAVKKCGFDYTDMLFCEKKQYVLKIWTVNDSKPFTFGYDIEEVCETEYEMILKAMNNEN